MNTRTAAHPNTNPIPQTSRTPINMNAYSAQGGPRQTSRLQNSRSTGLGSGNAGAGWSFGAPSSFGGLGGGPSFNQGRPGQLTGFAQVMGGGSGQAPLDMRDFPSLSGTGATQSSATPGGWSSNVIRQSSTQQQQQQLPQGSNQQQQQLTRAPSAAPSHHSLDQYESQRSQRASTERSGGDDHQSSSGQPNGSTLSQANGGFGGSLGSPTETHSQLNGHQIQLPVRESPATYSSSHPIGSAQSQPPESSNSMSAVSDSMDRKWADMTEQEKYGMAGLEHRLIMKARLDLGQPIDETLPAKELSAAMLMNLNPASLGMDLDSPEPLYKTFHPFPKLDGSNTIFDIRDRQPVPAFTISDSYKVNNVPPISSRVGSYSEDTLFQIFYQEPRTVNQELAAQELSNREWRWHKVLRQWLQRDSGDSHNSGHVVDLTTGPMMPPQRINDHTERGIYVFFDPMNWRRERREFTLDLSDLEERISGASAATATGGPAGGLAGTLNAAAGFS